MSIIILRRSVLALMLVVVCDIAVAYHETPPPTQANSKGTLAPSATVWDQRRVSEGIVYFLDNTGLRIRRFDADTETWLADVALGGVADAFDVDVDGVYVKYADHVERLPHDGPGFVYPPAVSGDWPFLEVIGNALVLGEQNELFSFDKLTGAPINSIGAWTRLTGSSAIDAEGRIFGRTTGVSPSDIYQITLDTSGSLISYMDSPYHGAYPGATQVFARMAGGMVVDSAGIVYASDDLQYFGSLGGVTSGVAFLADSIAVMRAGWLSLFSYELREIGRLPYAPGILDIVAVDGELYAISDSNGSLIMSPVDVHDAEPLTPPPARPWKEGGAHADFILGDADRMILVSKSGHAAYGFSQQTWAFDAATPMFVNPLHAAYSAVDDRLYAAYDGGAIYAFPMQQVGAVSWLAATPNTSFGIATAGEYVFAGDNSGAWESHYTFSPSGAMLSNPDWNHYSRQFEWDPITRRMYFFRDGVSPNDLLFEQIGIDGTIVADGESPYHGGVYADTPIRVSPDGALVVIGSGQMFESGGLTMVGDIGPIEDASWLFGNLYAITSGDEPRLQRYDTGYNVVSSGRVRGTPLRLLPSGSGFIYVASVGSMTVIGRLDGFLAKADLAIDPLSIGSIFADGSVVTLHVQVGNNGVVPANGATVTADLSGLENVNWRCIPVALVSGCDGIEQFGPLFDEIDLEDGGQAEFEITGRIPAGSESEIQILIGIDPALTSTDPELRNNQQILRIPLNRLFANGFD